MSMRDTINENNEEYTEDTEVVSSRSLNLLKVEYERCRQEIYDLKRKLQLNEIMLQEVQETNEAMERSFDRRISEKKKIIFETEERNRILTKEYENIISNLETKLAQQAQEIEELRRVDRCVETECTISEDRSENLSFETNDDTSLRNRIDELTSILQEERNKSERAEQTIDELKTRCDEFEYYSRSIKEQLDEKKQALEEARAELTLRHAEAISLEMDPTYESRKGNSLFAEVEDRRQNVVSKMSILREKYTEIKRVCKSQIADIKMLRAEHIATLRKRENDTDHRLTENNELIQKYKSRISDLESKLKSEIKKNDDSKQLNYDSDTSFGYFQSLLNVKKKEADELRIKVEDLYTKFLVQEETNMNITKQLRYWRYKASALEAQTRAGQVELKLNLTDDVEHAIFKDFEDLTIEHHSDAINDEKQFILQQQSENSDPDPENPQSLPLNNFSKTENTHCFFKNPEDRKTHCQLMDKEKSNQSGIVEFRIITPKKSCKFERDQNTNKENKPLRSMENTTTIKKSNNPEKTATDCKYSVVYIPTNLNG